MFVLAACIAASSLSALGPVRPARATAYLLIVGASDFSQVVYPNVYYAPILGGGALGAWTATNFLPAPRMECGLAVSGSYVFAVGGAVGYFAADIRSTVYSAQIFSGGGVFPWAATTPVPYPIYQPSVWASGSALYHAGGNQSGAITSSAYWATVAGGNASNWAATTAQPGERDEQGYTAMDGYFFVLGGRQTSGLNATNTVWSIQGTGGALGSWNTLTPLPFNDVQPGFVATNGYLYQCGGNISGGGAIPVSASYSVPESGGTIGTWTSITPLPIPLHEHAMVAAGNYLYCLGGRTTGGGFVSTCYYTTATAGAISGWTVTSALPFQMSEHAVVLADLSSPSATLTPSPSRSPTRSATETRSDTATSTATRTMTFSSSQTPSPSRTESGTHTASPTPSETPSVSATSTESETYTPSETSTVTGTASGTATASRTSTETATATETETFTESWTPSKTRTLTETPTATLTGSPSETWTVSPTATATPTISYTRTATFTPTISWTRTATPTVSATRTESPTRTITPTAGGTVTRTPVPGCDPGLEAPFLYVSVNRFDASSETAQVCFAIPDDERVKVRVFNSAGERIARLYEGPAIAGTVYSRIWNGLNESGALVATGVYVVRLDSDGWKLKSKVAVVR